MAVDEFIRFEQPHDLGSDWSAVGFWTRPGARTLVRLQGPDRIVEVELDVVSATFLGEVPCPSTGKRVEQLVLAISCEMSNISMTLTE